MFSLSSISIDPHSQSQLQQSATIIASVTLLDHFKDAEAHFTQLKEVQAAIRYQMGVNIDTRDFATATECLRKVFASYFEQPIPVLIPQESVKLILQDLCNQSPDLGIIATDLFYFLFSADELTQTFAQWQEKSSLTEDQSLELFKDLTPQGFNLAPLAYWQKSLPQAQRFLLCQKLIHSAPQEILNDIRSWNLTQEQRFKTCKEAASGASNVVITEPMLYDQTEAQMADILELLAPKKGLEVFFADDFKHKKLLTYRNRQLRPAFIAHLVALFNQPKQRDYLLKHLEGGDFPVHAKLPLLLITAFSANTTEAACDALVAYIRKERNFRDSKHIAPLNSCLHMLASMSIKSEDLTYLIELIAKEDTIANKNKTLTMLKILLCKPTTAALPLTHISPNNLVSSLKTNGNLESIFQQKYKVSLPIKDFQLFLAKQEELESRFKTPNALASWGLNLATYGSQKTFANFVDNLLSDNFPAVRYSFDNNEHLKKLFTGREGLLEKWKENQVAPLTKFFPESEDPKCQGWTITKTDSAEGILDSLHDIPTCISLGGQNANCMPTLLLDGKMALVAIQDEKGKYIMRGTLRILFANNFAAELFNNNFDPYDSHYVFTMQRRLHTLFVNSCDPTSFDSQLKPALFLDILYPKLTVMKNYPNEAKALGSFIKSYADDLGIPLWTGNPIVENSTLTKTVLCCGPHSTNSKEWVDMGGTGTNGDMKETNKPFTIAGDFYKC